jgi:hypothetical protein
MARDKPVSPGSRGQTGGADSGVNCLNPEQEKDGPEMEFITEHFHWGFWA